MMKRLILASAAIAAAVPAAANPPPWAPANGWRAHQAQAQAYYQGSNGYYGNQGYNQGYGNQGYNNGYYNRGYNTRGYYGDRVGYDTRVWRGRDGRYYCRRSNGTTGLIVGGAVGALLGRSLDYSRSRTVGTLIGGAAGALLGREVERGSMRCR